MLGSKLKTVTVKEIEQMNYNELIAFVEETNRIPGGYRTISNIINHCFLKDGMNILEIGTSTGSTSIEIAKIINCHINAVDINQMSIETARSKAIQEGVGDRIDFSIDDAQNLNFPDAFFDCVICGNVTSLLPDKEKARKEYCRVLKQNGLLAAVPMYYLTPPDDELLDAVRNAIRSDVKVVSADYWVRFYKESGMMLKFRQDFRFRYIDNTELDNYINLILNKDYIRALNKEAYQALTEKYRRFIYLFRDNISKMGYSILILKKEPYNTEPELFMGECV